MSWKKVGLKIGSICLGVGILVGLIIYSGTSEIGSLLKELSWVKLIIASAFYMSVWIFRPWFIKIHSHLTWKDCAKIISIANVLNALLPAKAGDINLIYTLKKRGIGLARSINILIHYRIMDILSLTIITIPLLIIYLKESLPERITNYMIVVLAILAIPTLMLLDRGGIINRILKFMEEKLSLKFFKGMLNKSIKLYEDYEDLLKSKKTISVLTSLSAWIIEGVTSYFIAVALGYPIPLHIIFLAISLGNISKVIPITPGGIGLFETTMILVLSVFNIPLSVATTLAILDHGLKTGLGLLVGGMVLIFQKNETPYITLER